MSGQPTEGRGGARRRRKKLNQPLIKSLIVMAAAFAASVGSAISGISAHLGFAPMLTWMFGYSTVKAQGTALRFSVLASVVAIVSYFGYTHGDNLQAHLLRGIFLFAGAAIGALMAVPITPKPTAVGILRALQGIAILATLFTATEALHLSAVTRSNAHYALWSSWWQLLLVATVAGAVSQAGRIASASVLVPAVYFLTAISDTHGVRSLDASEAILEVLISVTLASLLPAAVTYTSPELADTTYLLPAALGGVVGGVAGGWLLSKLVERAILLLFAAVGMFFAAREVFRLAVSAAPADESAAPPDTPIES